MASRPDLIYCAGGNPRFAEIAVAHGFLYGSRLPSHKPYAPLAFADQDWRRPDRAAYMAALAVYRPTMASVLDWEQETQLSDVLDWAAEAAQYVERVMIIPKVQAGIDRLPRRIGRAAVVLGYSVPTRHGGTEVPAWEFAGWPVHLLGGSPEAQMRIWRYLRGIADVVSVDGNMANRMAHRWCAFWRAAPGVRGHWVQLSEVGDRGRGNDANARAFQRSCVNIAEAWRTAA